MLVLILKISFTFSIAYELPKFAALTLHLHKELLTGFL